MLNLHNLNIDLEKAKQEHFNYFKPVVKMRLARLEHYPFLREFFNEKDHLDLLILGLPDELNLLNNLFIHQVDKYFSIGTYNAFISLSKEKRKKCTHPISIFMKEIEKIFNYT